MKDLSSLCGKLGDALIGGSSSSAGNTINYPVTSVGPAPGSMPVNPIPDASGLAAMDQPALETPAENENVMKSKYGNGPTSTSATWKKV